MQSCIQAEVAIYTQASIHLFDIFMCMPLQSQLCFFKKTNSIQ